MEPSLPDEVPFLSHRFVLGLGVAFAAVALAMMFVAGLAEMLMVELVMLTLALVVRWVWVDALEHGASPWLWAAIVLVAPLLGLLLYLAVGRRSPRAS